MRIDGRDIAIQGRPSVLEAARANGIDIPSLCDHPGLDPFAGCRLCLVEIKGRRGYAPACGTVAEEGMEVATATPELRELRKGILELILSEHPNACLACGDRASCENLKSTMRKVADVTGCLTCPQNGRCRLQEVMDLVGLERVALPSMFRNRDIRREDPFFDRDDNLCILCGRCVRVCAEVRGNAVLTFVSRGSDTMVGTALDRGLLASGCQFCGACVDVCPTGSLIERGVRVEGRPDASAPSVCPLCSLGCALDVGLRNGRILATTPADGGQICVKGRFLVREIAASRRRILRPHVRRGGALEPAGWDEALETAAARLREAGPKTIAVLHAPEASLEEAYLARKLGRALGAGRVSGTGPEPFLGRVRDWESAHETRLGGGDAIEFEETEAIVVLGLNLPVSHPPLWVKAVAAGRHGAELIVAHSGHLTNPGPASLVLCHAPGSETALLSALLKIMAAETAPKGGGRGEQEFRSSLESLDLDALLETAGIAEDEIRAAARILGRAASVRVLFGGESFGGDDPGEALSAVWDLGLWTGGRLHPLPASINEKAWVDIAAAAGSGTASGPADEEWKAMILGGPAAVSSGSKPAFLAVIDSHWSEASEAADVVLPAAVFTESGGRWLTADGRTIDAESVTPAPRETRPGWQIYRDLARVMGLEGFAPESLDEVRAEIAREVPGLAPGTKPERRPAGKAAFIPLAPPPASRPESTAFPLLLTAGWDYDRYRGCRLAVEARGFGRARNSRRVWIAAADAAAAGIAAGEEVVVETAAGAMTGIAAISESLAPGRLEAVRTTGGTDGPRPARIRRSE